MKENVHIEHFSSQILLLHFSILCFTLYFHLCFFLFFFLNFRKIINNAFSNSKKKCFPAQKFDFLKNFYQRKHCFCDANNLLQTKRKKAEVYKYFESIDVPWMKMHRCFIVELLEKITIQLILRHRLMQSYNEFTGLLLIFITCITKEKRVLWMRGLIFI